MTIREYVQKNIIYNIGFIGMAGSIIIDILIEFLQNGINKDMLGKWKIRLKII